MIPKALRRKSTWFEVAITILTTLVLLVAFVPIFTMIILSLKSDIQIYGNFFSLPKPVQWGNYSKAFGMLLPNMINTLIVVAVATVATTILATVSGYVFARLRFPCKEFLYMCVLALMMVPGILTLVPQYSLIQKYGLYNSWGALIFPWVSGGQVFGIVLCRNYMEGLPGEMFESARLDGCRELRMLWSIAVPISKPIIATIVVMKMIDYYNDFIWPLMVIESNSKQVISVAIRVFQSSTGSNNGGINIGVMVAGFVIATLPLFILFMFGSRLYMEGLTAGAVKG